MFLIGGLLHRMILWELIKVFCMALTSLTGLFLVGLVVQQANQMGLTIGQTLAVLPLLIPYTLPYTIPATTLFASCVVYGRLAHDNEAVAMKAAGIDLYTVVRPALVLGLITAGITFYLAHKVIPQTQTMLQLQVMKDPEELLYNLLKRERFFRANNFPYVIYVKDVQGRRLMDVVVKKKEMVHEPLTGKQIWSGKYEFVVRAREARLRVAMPDDADPEAKPMLYIDPDRWVGGYESATIRLDGNRPVGVPLPESFAGKDLRDKPMNLEWTELPKKMVDFKQKYEESEEERAFTARAEAQAADPEEKKRLAAHGMGLKYQGEHWLRQFRNTECEYHMRPALATGCILFALVGCPIGMWANRSDYLSAFVTGFLPTVCIYYPLLLAGSNLGRDGSVPMAAGVYLANAIIAVSSLLLIWRLVKR